MGKRLESTLAILNGAVGDHLARTGNGLTTPMTLLDGQGAPFHGRADAAARVVVLVHGLMTNETVWAFPDDSDYGSKLEDDAGFTPLYLRYNSGLPIADNGALLADLLDALVAAYPVPIEEILLLGYSMGGLVVRSACHVGASRASPFLSRVHRAIYVGTPHLGAPYERLGRVVSRLLRAVNDPTVKLIADIADLRSAGLQDLGDADLRHVDREERTAGVRLSDWRHPVPLLPQMEHYLVAGSLAKEAGSVLAALFGDSVVPVKSALAGVSEDGLPASHVCVLPGLSHMSLAHDLAVYAQVRAWAGGKP